jgi:hypothetical protein
VNAFKSLWLSLAQLAASLANLSDTINGIDGQLRQRAGLDEAPAALESNGEPEPAALPAARKRKPLQQHAEEK